MRVMYPGKWLTPRVAPVIHPAYLVLDLADGLRLLYLRRPGGDGSWEIPCREALATTGSVWRSISEVAASVTGPITWAAHGAYDLLCSLGLWDELEAGRIRISYDPRRVEARKSLAGAYVCESELLIVDLLLGEQRRKLRVIDLGNYGFRPPACQRTDPQWSETECDHVDGWLSLCQGMGLRSACPTAASAGYHLWQSLLAPAKVYAHAHAPARQLERQANYGGRCEAFRLGLLEGDWYYCDLRGMYSQIVKHYQMPTLLVDYQDGGLEVGDEAFEAHYTIADVLVESDAALPVPVRYSGGVVYPTGTVRTVLADPLLAHYSRSGRVRRVYRRAVYEMGRPFADWYPDLVLAAGELRLEKYPGIRCVAKRIVNSTYGRIGAGGREWVDADHQEPLHRWDWCLGARPDTGEVTVYRTVDGVLQWLDDQAEPELSLPSISAAICAYGQYALGTILRRIDRANVAYCDTDGAIVNRVGTNQWQRALDQPSLPQFLSSIKDDDSNVEIFGLKQFRFGRRYTCSGVPLERCRETPDGLVWDETVPMKHQLRQHRAFVRRAQLRVMKNRQHYRHGEVAPDGKITPYHLEYLHDDRRDGIEADPARWANVRMVDSPAAG